MKLKTAYDIDQDQIFSLIPELPEDIDKWIDENPMLKEQYFFTYRINGKKYGYCTHCKTDSPLSPELYRTADQNVLDNYRIKHNQKGICPNCGVPVVFKDDGRGRKYLIKFGYFTIAQPLADGGVMLRSFYVRKCLNGDYREAQNELSEHIRIYYNTGVTASYQRYWSGCFIPQQGDYYEEYSELYTAWNKLKKVPVPNPHRGNIYNSASFGTACRGFSDRALKNTIFKYACVDRAIEFLREGTLRNEEAIVKYLELYIKMPILVERLMKQGFEKIVFEKALCAADSRGLINWNKETVMDAFKGIAKDELKQIQGSSTAQLALFQLCKTGKASAKTREWLNGRHIYSRDAMQLIRITKRVPLNKIIKYMRSCDRKKQYLSIGDYSDYLDQCIKIGLDLKNPCILFPKNFQKAHNENTQLMAEIKAKKEAEKMKEQDKEFEQRYRSLCKKYAFENDILLLRPASGKAELLIEGKTLSHCVYTNYADSYISGRTLICVIRKKSDPEKPFYTLEYSPSSKTVLQCRGFRNCAMTDEVKTFCESWKLFLETKKTKKKQPLQIGA